jgi:SAM-dependent methyltransferase
MCGIDVIEFFINNIRIEEFKGKRILEVGSKYVNGSVRPLIERFCYQKEYVGVDIEAGKFVDIVLPAEKLVEYFGSKSFDVVISTELLEHIQDWRLIISNMKDVLKHGGYIYITTRSYGFPYHAYPYDFWRYEIEDMKRIFSDFNIIKLIKKVHGIFLKAKKPYFDSHIDLSNIALYSMIIGRRTFSIPKIVDMPLRKKLVLRLLNSKTKWLLPNLVNRFLEKSVM